MSIFDKTSLGNPELSQWAISEDGGEFDALTGASITSRAVVNAIRDTLTYFAANRAFVFAAGQDVAVEDAADSGETNDVIE